MNKNLGIIDRTIRVLAAMVLAILILTGTITGPPAIILGVLAGMLLLTSSISFCPLYAFFKFTTRKKEAAK